MSNVPHKLQEVYRKWENKSAPNVTARFSTGSYQQSNFRDRRRPRSAYSTQNKKFEPPNIERRNRQFQRPPEKRRPRYDALASFKMAPTIQPVINSRPFVGLCCTKCLPQSRAAIPNSYIHSLCVCNLFLLPYEEKNGLSVIPSSFRPICYILSRSGKFRYPDVSCKVLQSERIRDVIIKELEDSELKDGQVGGQSLGSESSAELLKEKSDNAVRILKSMKASVSPFLLKLAAWSLYKTLPGIFRSIHIHRGHVEMLKAANKEDCPIVYVPLHCSSLDHLLVSFILYMNDLRVPVIATDDHPSYSMCFRKLLQYLGAFFVKTKTGKKDLVYEAVLQSYITECLRIGYSLNICNEASWLYHKKCLTSSHSLLSILIDIVLEDVIDDVYVVPISLSYEKIADSNYVSEQLGKPKMSDGILSMWRSLFTFLCTVRVDFGQPFSLKEFLHMNKYSSVPKPSVPCMETPPSSPSSGNNSSTEYTSNKTTNSYRSAVKCLHRHVTYDAACSTALMSTHLLAFLFLTKHRQGATQPQLVCSLNSIREDLIRRKRNVGFTGESASVIKHAINILGKELVSTEAIELEWTTSDMENNNMKFLFHKPIIKLPHVIELQYYSSFVVPAFVLDSILVNALYAVLDDEICHFQLCESKLLVQRQELIDKATELCSILQYEFVCIPPCTDLETALNDVIEELLAKECLHIAGGITFASGRVQKVLSKKSNLSFAPSDDDDDGDYHGNVQQQLKVDLHKESIDQLEFLRCILSPYIESYWLAACTLLKLLYEIVEEKEFIRKVQRMAEDRLGKGLLGYEESFGTGTLRNAVKLFECRRIIECYKEDNLKILYLSDSYDSEDKVNTVISWIEQFRK